MIYDNEVVTDTKLNLDSPDAREGKILLFKEGLNTCTVFDENSCPN